MQHQHITVERRWYRLGCSTVAFLATGEQINVQRSKLEIEIEMEEKREEKNKRAFLFVFPRRAGNRTRARNAGPFYPEGLTTSSVARETESKHTDSRSGGRWSIKQGFLISRKATDLPQRHDGSYIMGERERE